MVEKYQLGELPGSEEFKGFFKKVDGLKESGQVDFITVTKENFAQNEKLLDKVYNDYYTKIFPDPTEREPLDRWKEDIKAGLEAPNVRVITVFGSNLSNPEEAKIASVGASELYRIGQGEVCMFPNYYFSCSKVEHTVDARSETSPPIPLMFAVQLREAQTIAAQMGGSITSAFFEAEEPGKIKAAVAMDLAEKMGLPQADAVELVEKLSGGKTERETAIAALPPGEVQEAAREASAMMRQVIGRDRMYEGLMQRLGVDYYDVPGYGQPALEAEEDPCLVLKGRGVGSAAQIGGFLDQFFMAFAEKDVKALGAADENFRVLAEQLPRDIEAGKGKPFEIDPRRAEGLAGLFEKDLDKHLFAQLAQVPHKGDKLATRDNLPLGGAATGVTS